MALTREQWRLLWAYERREHEARERAKAEAKAERRAAEELASAREATRLRRIPPRDGQGDEHLPPALRLMLRRRG